MRVVVVANIVMSLDNVIAVAAAAKGNFLLLGLGLAVSIPVVIAGSAIFLAIIGRFPLVVWGGGALLGWIAGGLIPEDPMVQKILAGTTMVAMETEYNLFGYAGHLKWDFDFELFEVLCGHHRRHHRGRGRPPSAARRPHPGVGGGRRHAHAKRQGTRPECEGTPRRPAGRGKGLRLHNRLPARRARDTIRSPMIGVRPQ